MFVNLYHALKIEKDTHVDEVRPLHQSKVIDSTGTDPDCVDTLAKLQSGTGTSPH